jgi:hypothetical protein
MLELGIAALVIAIVIRLIAGLARLAFGLLLVAGVALIVLGLLGVELSAVLSMLGIRPGA